MGAGMTSPLLISIPTPLCTNCETPSKQLPSVSLFPRPCLMSTWQCLCATPSIQSALSTRRPPPSSSSPRRSLQPCATPTVRSHKTQPRLDSHLPILSWPVPSLKLRVGELGTPTSGSRCPQPQSRKLGPKWTSGLARLPLLWQ